LYMLLRRHASFYHRAQEHDLSCVREAFLFDMCHLYPDPCSCTFQLIQMLRQIGIDIYRMMLPLFLATSQNFTESLQIPRPFASNSLGLVRRTPYRFFAFFRTNQPPPAPFCHHVRVQNRIFFFYFSPRGSDGDFFMTPLAAPHARSAQFASGHGSTSFLVIYALYTVVSLRLLS
jgi:hypothetical protein